MRKFILICSCALAFGSEFQYGSGTIKPEILGFSKSMDVKSFSLTQKHKNIKNFYYGYDLTYYKSESVDYAFSYFNTFAKVIDVNYKLRGLDLDINLGYDLHKTPKSYLGFGAALGISIPYIKTKSSSNDYPFLENSKTKFLTYKIGLNISSGYDFNRFLGFKVDAISAYQIASIKNDYVNKSVKATGIYNSLDVAFRFTPFKAKKKIGFITFAPKFYIDFGYKYRYWKFNNVESEVFNLNLEKADFKIKSNVAYIGLGYEF